MMYIFEPFKNTMNPSIIKYSIYLVIVFKTFIYSYGGVGINSGIHFFSVKSSLDLYVKENNRNIASVNNYGMTNGFNIGTYLYFSLNEGNLDFEYDQLKKEYQFSFKNNLNFSQNNDSKIYNTNFLQKRFCVTLNKYVITKNFKPYIFSKGFLGFGMGIISSTPVIDNNLFKNNSSSFIFDGSGEPNLEYGTLSLSKLNDQIMKDRLLKFTSSYLLQAGYKIRLINLELIILYKYEMMNDKPHQDYFNWGSFKLRLGLNI